MANPPDRNWDEGPDERERGRQRHYPSEFGNYPRREDRDGYRPRSWISDPPPDRFFDPYAEDWTRPTRIQQPTPQAGPFAGRGPKNYTRSDERIREEACDRLTQDPSIDASEIELRVKDGEITLEGFVAERRMKHLAEDCVECVSGVREVTNQLRVQQPTQISGRMGSRDA